VLYAARQSKNIWGHQSTNTRTGSAKLNHQGQTDNKNKKPLKVAGAGAVMGSLSQQDRKIGQMKNITRHNS
jgi:hypothetical protein